MMTLEALTGIHPATPTDCPAHGTDCADWQDIHSTEGVTA